MWTHDISNREGEYLEIGTALVYEYEDKGKVTETEGLWRRVILNVEAEHLDFRVALGHEIKDKCIDTRTEGLWETWNCTCYAVEK